MWMSTPLPAPVSSRAEGTLARWQGWVADRGFPAATVSIGSHGDSIRNDIYRNDIYNDRLVLSSFPRARRRADSPSTMRNSPRPMVQA